MAKGPIRTFHLALAAWGTYFIGRTLQKSSTNDAAIAGALIGLSILVLQHKGAAIALTGLVALLIHAAIDRGGSGGHDRKVWAWRERMSRGD